MADSAASRERAVNLEILIDYISSIHQFLFNENLLPYQFHLLGK